MLGLRFTLGFNIDIGPARMPEDRDVGNTSDFCLFICFFLSSTLHSFIISLRCVYLLPRILIHCMRYRIDEIYTHRSERNKEKFVITDHKYFINNVII